MINTELQTKLREKFNPDGSNLRRAQLRMLQMLEFIDDVCKKNDITYWLDSGTLLGAVRHGGYIPWDDDTDICMSAEDYRKFKKIMLTQKLSDEFVLQCDETDSGFYSPWDVLRDLKSEYVQDSVLHNKRKYRGVQVDIFYQDDRVYEHARKWMTVLYNKLILRAIAGKSVKARLFRPIVPVSYFFLKKIATPLLHLVHCKRNDYYRMPYGVPFKSIRYKKNIFPIGHIEFEGKMFNAPHNVEGYLKDIYGDWEKIPDVDEIQTHNVELKFY